MAARNEILRHTVRQTTINEGSISASKKTVVQQLPPIPNRHSSRDFAVVSGRDESRIYNLTLSKRMMEEYPKETLDGLGLKKFMEDYGLGLGNKIILYKETGVNRLANAVITEDSFIIDFEGPILAP